MLASPVKDIDQLQYPLAVTPKVDGIRCVIDGGRGKSRTWKDIPSPDVQEMIADYKLPNGLDGELVLPAPFTFQDTTSAVMTHTGTETSHLLEYHVFDLVRDGWESMGYIARTAAMIGDFIGPQNLGGGTELVMATRLLRVKIIVPHMVHNKDELLAFEAKCLDAEYEGVCMRQPESPYKSGRSTFKQGWLLKMKRFVDEEAIITGFEEMERNTNEKLRDAFGRAKRSQAQAGKVAAGMLGKIVARSEKWGEIKIGSGFDLAQRIQFWDPAVQATMLGKIVKFKYFPVGCLDKPRHPIFLGLRHPDDM
jgi:DNA ligase-1